MTWFLYMFLVLSQSWLLTWMYCYIPKQAAISCTCFAHLLLPGLHQIFSCNFTVMTPTLTVQEKSLLLRLSRSVDWEVLERQCGSKPCFCMTSKWSWSMKANETKTILYGLCYAFMFPWIVLIYILSDQQSKFLDVFLKAKYSVDNIWNI